MIVTSNLIQTPKVVTIDQNRWSRSVKFTGHDLLEWVVTVDQNTHHTMKGVKLPAKYKNPLNPNQTWTGRGVDPAWVATLRELGQLEAALIHSPDATIN